MKRNLIKTLIGFVALLCGCSLGVLLAGKFGVEVAWCSHHAAVWSFSITLFLVAILVWILRYDEIPWITPTVYLVGTLVMFFVIWKFSLNDMFAEFFLALWVVVSVIALQAHAYYPTPEEIASSKKEIPLQKLRETLKEMVAAGEMRPQTSRQILANFEDPPFDNPKQQNV